MQKPDPSKKLQKSQPNIDVGGAKSGLSCTFDSLWVLIELQQAEVFEGATYNPSKMPDYDPNTFKLGDARLIQQNMFDKNSKPIPPWEAASAFAPGTLVAVDAHLVVYHFLASSESNAGNHVRSSYFS